MGRPHPSLVDLAAGRNPVGVPADPGQLVRSAIEHRMAGLLWSSVEAGRIDLPPRNRLDLARLDLQTRAHHERLWRTLDRIIDHLDAEGIAVASAKGVVAEKRWYDRLGERPCIDIDLLLDPADLGRASAVLAALQPDHELLADIDEIARTGRLQSVDVLFDDVEVDLHFDILKLGVGIRNPSLVWDRTEIVITPGGRRIRALDAEMSFAVLLIHALKDRFAYLLGLTDVRRLGDIAGLDWVFIEKFMESEGLSAVGYSSLEAIYEALGLDAPTHPAIRGWRGAASRRLWPSSIRLQGQVGRIDHHRRQKLVPFLMPGRGLDGAAALTRLTFPSSRLVDYYHWDTTGPYLWRLAVGRLRRARERREAIMELTESSSPAARTRLETGATRDPTTVERYKEFPPGVGHLKVPVSSKAAAKTAIAMYSATRSRALVAQRLALVAVAVGGPRLLPGRTMGWKAPENWPAIAERLATEIGPYDTTIVHERAQPDRSGLALLLMRGDRPLAFVKVQPTDSSGLLREQEALEAMHRSAPILFSIPAIITAGKVDGWRFLALGPFSVAHHRPPSEPPLTQITAEIAAGLASLPRPAETPGHWSPMHGDLTPWNLRQFAGGLLLLVDWEEAGWAPPGADEVLYRAAEAALTRRALPVDDYPEAVAFWQQRLTRRAATRREQRLRSALLQHLDRS